MSVKGNTNKRGNSRVFLIENRAGPTNVPVQISPEAQFEKAVQGGDQAMWDSVKAKTEASWTKSGRMTP